MTFVWVLPLFSFFLLCSTLDDSIYSLPNQRQPLNFRQYAGYLKISPVKQLYYWLAESPDPENTPLVLWLNGGPGCSSMQGLLLEHGPFRVRDDGNTVELNPYAWNQYASFLYLDAPAGVGYSFRTDGLYNYTDDEVAEDNEKALLQFFQRYPQKMKNTFYISGESYAGTYIPMLAKRLLANKANFPQFKGMLIGNGCINERSNFNTGIQYAYQHALIDERQYRQVLDKCCGGNTDCDLYSMAVDKTHACYNDANALDAAKYYAGLDPYYLSFACYLDGSESSSEDSIYDIRHVMMKTLTKNGPLINYEDLPNCAHHNDFVAWLNRKDVRDAINVPEYVQNYSSCSERIEKDYIVQYRDISPFISNAVKGGLKVLFFNGDMDSICNHVHNSIILSSLGLPLEQPATPWLYEKEKPKTAGLYTKYTGLDYLTVRNAGHFTSSDAQKPRESLQMFYNYIMGLNYSIPVPEKPLYHSTYYTAYQSSTTPGDSTSSNSILLPFLFIFIMKIFNF